MRIEYLVREYAPEDAKRTEDRFNALGKDGWELVFIDEINGYKKAIFKRLIETPFIAGITQ